MGRSGKQFLLVCMVLAVLATPLLAQLPPECTMTSANRAPEACRSDGSPSSGFAPSSPGVGIGDNAVDSRLDTVDLTSGVISPGPGITRPNFYSGCDFANNDFSTLYCVEFDTGGFYAVDATTGVGTLIGTAVSQFGNWSGLAWDSFTGTMYGADTNIVTSGYYTIDLATGAATLIGTMGGAAPAIIAIGVDATGGHYGYDIVTDTLVAIDPTTGNATTVGPLGFDANFAQGMDFDHSTNTCYLFAFNNGTFQGELRTCDTGSGSTALVGTLFDGDTFNEITGAGIDEPDAGGGVPTTGTYGLAALAVLLLAAGAFVLYRRRIAF